MFELKPISKDTIPAAFERAERYRQMNEPLDAESICLDILNIDPDNQRALETLLLAISEQFGAGLYPAYEKAMDILCRLKEVSSRTFYEGLIYERRAKALLKLNGLGAGKMAYGWFKKAMHSYDMAIELGPPRKDDAVLRWNTCARVIMQNPEVEPERQKYGEEMLE